MYELGSGSIKFILDFFATFVEDRRDTVKQTGIEKVLGQKLKPISLSI